MDPFANSYNSFGELVKLKCELSKNIEIIMAQQSELEQAKDKIYKQDQQLEEAAEILQLQHKILNASEQERKKKEKTLQETELEKRQQEEKCQRLENILEFAQMEILGLLQILTKDNNNNENITNYEGLFQENLQDRILALAKTLKNKFTERMKEQEKLRKEMSFLRKVLGDTQKELEISRQKQQQQCHIPAMYMPVVKVEKLDLNANQLFHKKEIHSQQPKDKKWIPCTKCDKSFLGKWSLTRHYRTEHHQQQRKRITASFSCRECGFIYISEELLQRHQKKCWAKSAAAAKTLEHKLVEIRLDIVNSSGDEDESMERIIDVRGKSIYLRPHL